MAKLGSLAVTLVVASLAFGPLGVSIPLVGVQAAYAENGKGNSGNGKSNRNKSSRSSKSAASSQGGEEEVGAHGLMAEELEGLNAIQANPSALNSASENSQVGRIAIYRDAALATIDAQNDVADAEATLAQTQAALLDVQGSWSGPSSTELLAAIQALDPADPNYQTYFDALNADLQAALDYESSIATLTQQVADAEAALADAEDALASAEAAEADALLAASGGRELSAEAVGYIRQVLGI